MTNVIGAPETTARGIIRGPKRICKEFIETLSGLAKLYHCRFTYSKLKRASTLFWRAHTYHFTVTGLPLDMRYVVELLEHAFRDCRVAVTTKKVESQ